LPWQWIDWGSGKTVDDYLACAADGCISTFWANDRTLLTYWNIPAHADDVASAPVHRRCGRQQWPQPHG
jgi:hypothetical protein